MNTTNKKAHIYKMNLVPANILSIIIFILLLVLTMLLNINILIDNQNILIAFILMILYLGLHELLHGVGFFIGGTKRENIKYGICLEKGIFYCMACEEITKKNILISLQMPFMVIGIITYIIGAIFNIPILVLLSIVNITGASMDIAMFFYILSLPKDVTYSETSKPDEFVLISKTDLTTKKNPFIKVVEVKDYHKKDYIFKNTKIIEITKTSIIVLIMFILLGLIIAIL